MSSAFVSGLGIVVVTGLACAAILAHPGRVRSLAMLAALALVPALILADQWDTERIVALRDTPERMVAGAVIGLALVGAGAVAFARRPLLVPLVIAAAIPFRVPLQAGDEQANLLVPLYLAIAAGALYLALRDSGGPLGAVAARVAGGRVGTGVADAGAGGASKAVGAGRRWPRSAAEWLPWALVGVVALYGLQSLYSSDISSALHDACFFLVPFSIAFVLFREVDWSSRLLCLLLAVLAAEAAVFALIGLGEYAIRDLLWNPEIMRANEFHAYFRVNSLFWDPNVLARFLALVGVGLAAAMIWARELRALAVIALLVGVVWAGMFVTFSISGFTALLAGLAVLAALRWSVRWTAAVAAVCAVGALALAAAEGGFFETDWGLANRTSGRSNLVKGGLELFADRPLAGHGSAAFPEAYQEHYAEGRARLTVSHTEPVTVAAEQGIVGLAAYFGLIAAALGAMASGLRARLSELRRHPSTAGVVTVARVAVLAAFVAMLIHTLSYAGFLDDPLTWLLFALACALPSAAPEGPAEAGSGPAVGAGRRAGSHTQA